MPAVPTEITIHQIEPGSANQLLGVVNAGTSNEWKTLSGTTNQIIKTDGVGTITLSTPQDIAISSSPTFASETLTNTTNQLSLGTTRLIIVNAPTPAVTSRTVTIPDPGAAANFVLSESSQTLNGALTLSSALTITPATNQLILSGPTRTATISAVQPATSSRIYTIPDQGSAANFVLDQANYTISGTWNFAHSITLQNQSATVYQDLSLTPKSVTVEAPDTVTSNYTLKLPITQGGASTVLTNDGSGNLSWASGSSGSGTVNSGTQYQLAYYATSTNAVSGLTLITANRALASDANGLPVASSTTATELGYVSGVTSAIQTQLNAKKTIATGNNYKFETTDATGNLQETTVTASRAVVTDANGLPSAATTTSTEIGYVNGVTSSIQTQLNNEVFNILVNGGFERWSTGTSFNLSAGGVFQIADGWFVQMYSPAASVVFSQETSVVDTGESALNISASAGQSGYIFQPIANFQEYAGKTVSFSCRFRGSGTVTNFGAGCGLWDGVSFHAGNTVDDSSVYQTSSGSATISSSATCLFFVIADNISTGSTPAILGLTFGLSNPNYVDSCFLVLGSNLFSYGPDTGRSSDITPVVLGSDQIVGGLQLLQVSTPNAPVITNIGTTGTSSYSYKIVATLLDGSTSAASSAGSTSSGNASLTGAHYNRITWSPVSGAVSYDVYRTATNGTPSTTGKIANVATTVFNDTGFAGDSTTPPSTNTTGKLTADNISLTTPLTVVNGGTGQTTYTDGQLLIGNSSGNTLTKSTLTGTTNQVIVTNGNGSITLSTPQNIATSSSPTFVSETLSATTNQLVLGTTNTTTVTSPAPAASRVVTLPDAGTNSSFVLTESSQTINGAKTFSSTVSITPTTNQLVLGTTRTVTLSATQPATTSRTYTFSDITSDATIAYLEGTQTFTGAKTLNSATLGGNMNANSHKITSLTNGSASSDAAAFGQVTPLFAYRRPNLVYSSTTVVTLETGIVDGVSGDATILFPDGDLRTETSSTRYNMTISQNAVFTNATLGNNQGGLRTGSVAANTWYACYAVKVTTFAANWVMVADVVLPLQSNYSTLNSNFGTNGWVYLGMVRYGDNSGSTTVLLKFTQSGNLTIFQNSCTGNAQSSAGIRFATGSATGSVTYTATLGTGTTDIPNHLKNGIYSGAIGSTTNGGYFGESVGAPWWSVYAVESNADKAVCRIWMPLQNGAQQSASTGTATHDIYLTGWIDSVLGIGSNPFL